MNEIPPVPTPPATIPPTQPLPTIPQPPIVPPPKKNYLPIILSVLAILILAGGGGWYLLKQYTPNPTLPIQVTPTPPAGTQAETMPASSFATAVTIPGWNVYNLPQAKIQFQYPPELIVAPNIQNKTALAADQEYWVAVGNSEILYVDIFLYRSTKTAATWWNTEGEAKFEKLSSDVIESITPRPNLVLKYEAAPSSLAGKEALNVVVSSDYDTPQTPEKRYLTIFQNNGYIIMLSYSTQSIGIGKNSLERSKQILSTFKVMP